jgi:type I restriction enzyme S subunit
METSMENIKMERYPEYKDSGVKWIGEIPQEWEIQKGKWLFTKQERPVRKQDEIVTCFRDGQVTLRSNRKTEGFTNALKEHGYQGIRKGDLVIHNMDAFAGAIGVSESDGKSTPVYSACIPRQKNKVNPYYYAYFLRNLAKSGLIESLAKGIRERSTDFRFSDFGVLLLTFPSLPEQTRIAHFLDRKTAQIDQAIAQKERLIELLKERRQILIHNAVTRGLDPNVRMKDSGVEWIGMIPEHWEVVRLKDACNINQNSLPETTKKSFELEYVDIGSVSFEKGITQTENFIFKNAPSRARRLAKMGDTVISTVRTYLKAIDYIDEQKSHFIFSTGFAVLHPVRINSFFLSFIVKSDAFTNQVDVFSTGMSYPAINATDLGRLHLTIPPNTEQTQIAHFLDQKTTQIEQAINCKQAEIEKLKEYKATLINSAVTGKIKV